MQGYRIFDSDLKLVIKDFKVEENWPANKNNFAAILKVLQKHGMLQL